MQTTNFQNNSIVQKP